MLIHTPAQPGSVGHSKERRQEASGEWQTAVLRALGQRACRRGRWCRTRAVEAYSDYHILERLRLFWRPIPATGRDKEPRATLIWRRACKALACSARRTHSTTAIIAAV